MADNGGVDGWEGPGEPDVVSFGRSGQPRWRPPSWLRGRRATAGLVLVVVVALVGVALATRGHHKHSPPPRAEPTPQATPVTPVVIDLQHRLLDVRALWELFATGPGVLLRIVPAAGLVIRTPVPALRSTGPVSFVVGPRQAIIRPLDFVPGYLIPDSRRARRLPAALGTAGQAFPGPRPGQLWVQTKFGNRNVMSLVTYAGRRTGTSVTLRGPLVDLAVPDGRGYFLVQEDAAVYDIRPGRRQLVAHGTLTAAGPKAWLVTRCEHGRCRYTLINPASGAQHLVPGRAPHPGAGTPTGVTSPDGRFAAIYRHMPSRTQVRLINLITGADRTVTAAVTEPYGATALAWSPGSRWLFAVTANGSLVAIDPTSGRALPLGVGLPLVTQLAIRPAVPPAQ